MSVISKARSVAARAVIDTRPLKVPEFRRLWITTVVTSIGSQLTAVAVPKQIYDITSSSGWVGVAGGVGLVPLLVFGLWGGAIADAVDRRTVMLVSNVGIAITSALLWLQAFSGLDSVWIVLVLLGLQQSFVAVNMPTRSAAVARLVPDDLIPPANALNFTTTTFGVVFGPLAAGALIPLTGLSTLSLIDTVALVISAILVALLPRIPRGDAASGRAGLRDIVDGLKYLATRRLLLVSFVVDIIAMVAGMPRALFPQLADQVYNRPLGSGTALGLLFAAIGIGSLVFGVLSGWFARLPRQGMVIALAVMCWGLGIAAFGLTSSLWLAVVFLALAGGADLISAVHRSSMLQTEATDELRGRMQGVFTVVVAGGPRVADLVHGWAGQLFGPQVATVGGGLLVVVLTALTVCLVPSFWRYRRPAPASTSEESSTAAVP